MNVGITRAKELLVVVGNGNILKRDPYWKGFLGFVLRNRLYVFFVLCFHPMISVITVSYVCPKLMQYDLTLERHRYVGPTLDIEMDGNYISRLECVCLSPLLYQVHILNSDRRPTQIALGPRPRAQANPSKSCQRYWHEL